MVVALVALVAAFAGESIADVATKALTKKEKKQTKKIARNKANQAIDQRASGLSVANSVNATNAENAVNATNAENAASVPPNSIGTDEVSQLRAVDISTVSGIVTMNFGSIAANDCNTDTFETGMDIENDTVVVSVDDTAQYANGGLTVHASDSTAAGAFRINVCNVTGSAINPPSARFTFIVFQR